MGGGASANKRDPAMIPISGDNQSRGMPIVTWALIGICVDVFLWQLSLGARGSELRVYGFIPRNLFDHAVTETVYGIPWPWLTLMTSMFLHGGYLHLGGNMLYLWVFGNDVENAMGPIRFLLFYLACGIAAALTEGVANLHSPVSMIGASGAISGVLAAYVLIYPHARVRVIILPFSRKISALLFIGSWIFLQLWNVIMTPPGAPGTAWWAHVGGFFFGMALTPLMSSFPLFGRYTREPWS
jgi:membrane associated rhomboid family serine protease